MKYCTRCVLPETKPDLTFDEDGLCSACQNYDARKEIDWVKRHLELLEILDRYRGKGDYDCIVPVSGGKDSHAQTIKMLELGMKPLCVTATTCDESEIGRRNILNLQKLGVDHIQVTPNPLIRRKLNSIGLREVGDISWPEHVAIFTTPVRIAVNHRVPLIIWGENSQNEYGGPVDAARSQFLNRRWLEEFGGLLGLRVTDLPALFGINERDLVPYTYPRLDEISKVGVTGLFLGYFLPWDGAENARIAKQHGFETYTDENGVAKWVEGSCVDYENLDCYLTGIHDFMKFLKFGFGRTADLASMAIRRGKMTREEGYKLCVERDGQYPWSYLGKPLEEIIRPLGISLPELQTIFNKFTNKKIHPLEGIYPRDLVDA